MLDKALFMSCTTLPEDFQQRIPVLRLFQYPCSNCEVEIGQVPTIEMSDQVGGTKQNRIFELLHM
ncbi:hypothetical protein D3C84_855820 [compost metagenome]